MTNKRAMIMMVVLGSLALAACGSAARPPEAKTVPPRSKTASSGAVPSSAVRSSAASSRARRSVRVDDVAQRARLDQAFNAFSACMRANGVNPLTVPTSRQGSGASIDAGSASYRTIARKCGAGLRSAVEQDRPRATEAPKGGGASRHTMPPRNRIQPALELALERFSACMRAHGVNLSPPLTTGGSIFDTRHLDTNGTKFKAAEASCNSLLAQGVS